MHRKLITPHQPSFVSAVSLDSVVSRNLNIFKEFKYSKEQNPVSSDISVASIKNSIKADLESTSSLLNSDDMFQIARLLCSNPPVYLYSPAGLTDISVSYLESMLFISDCQKVYKTTASKALRHFIQTADKKSIFIFISNSDALNQL